jgi:hypothetical protein
MAGKLKKEVKQAVKAIKNPVAKAAAKKELSKALANNKGKTPTISQKELQRIQAAASQAGKGKNVVALSNIVHPQVRKSKSNTGSGVAASLPPPSSNYFSEPYVPPPPPPVRVPERDVVDLATQSIDAETITNLLFENIGANELTKFVRHDTVEGINPYYDIISNLSDIKRRFDPASLISLQKSNLSNFDIFPIKLQDRIPDEKYLEDSNLSEYVFFDDNGDLIIEVVNMADSEIVEVQIDTSGTIYEIEELYDNE